MKVIKITPPILRAVQKVISAALEYESLTGRKPGITGEVGEVLVCKKLRLQLAADPLVAGYDAVDKNGKKYQIKTRRAVRWERRYLGRIGIFARHEFDYAILAILDKNYKPRELYQISHKRITPILNRYPRRNPPIRVFVRNAKKV